MAQLVKKLLAMQETTCNVLDPSLISGSGRYSGKEMATHSSIFAWEIQWTEEPDCCNPWGLKRVGHNLATKQQMS